MTPNQVEAKLKLRAIQEQQEPATLLQALGRHFYEVVPLKYATYCSFTSRIAKAVLVHFGLPCELQPCQIWYCQPDHTYVIGFLGRPAKGKWDGHVVCRSGQWLLDTSIHHFAKEFDLPVPYVVSSACFEFPTQALSKWDVNASDRVWWHHPPQGADVMPPEEPQEIIDGYAAKLIEKLKTASV